MNRRAFLQAATLAAVGCSTKSGTGPFAGKILRVFVYDGGHYDSMRAAFVPIFEAKTGARVVLAPGWWDGMAKLKAAPEGQPPYDLMITDATQGYPAAREGRFRKINWANVPNKSKLAPEATAHWVCEQGYGLTYPDAVMTLAYRSDAVTPPPTRWQDLLRPDLAGKLGIYNHYYLSLYTFACILADQEGNKTPARELIQKRTDDVFKLAVQSRDRVKLWWPTTGQMILALANSEVAAGNMQSPEYLEAMRSKPELAASVPELDRAMVQVFWAIPAGTPEAELAELALNELFSPLVQRAFAERGSATARPEVAEAMANADPAWGKLYPHTPEGFRRLAYYPYDFYDQHSTELSDRWDRTVLRG